MYKYTNNWFEVCELRRMTTNILDPNKKNTILEIGNYEGQSSCFFSDNYLDHSESKMILVDPFSTTDSTSPVKSETEQLFLKNIEKSKNFNKVEIKRMTSDDFFAKNTSTFTFIYIDGSHEPEIITRDLKNAIECCDINGIIWMDDYLGGPKGSLQIKQAIDSVYKDFSFCLKPIWIGYQIAFLKLQSHKKEDFVPQGTIQLPFIYIIGSKQYEPDRMEYLESYFSTQPLLNIKTRMHCYKSTLTPDMLQTYVPVNRSKYNRPLRMGEISLFINHIKVFEEILKTHTSGSFLILENDVIFKEDLTEYLTNLLSSIPSLAYDCISIGSGCNQFVRRNPSNPAIFQFEQHVNTRCTDSLLFTYNGIKEFYTYICNNLAKGHSLDEPIDNYFDTFCRQNQQFRFLWVDPVVCYQGSEYNIYKSDVRPTTDDPDKYFS